MRKVHRIEFKRPEPTSPTVFDLDNTLLLDTWFTRNLIRLVPAERVKLFALANRVRTRFQKPSWLCEMLSHAINATILTSRLQIDEPAIVNRLLPMMGGNTLRVFTRKDLTITPQIFKLNMIEELRPRLVHEDDEAIVALIKGAFFDRISDVTELQLDY